MCTSTRSLTGSQPNKKFMEMTSARPQVLSAHHGWRGKDAQTQPGRHPSIHNLKPTDEEKRAPFPSSPAGAQPAAPAHARTLTPRRRRRTPCDCRPAAAGSTWRQTFNTSILLLYSCIVRCAPAGRTWRHTYYNFILLLHIRTVRCAPAG